MSKFQVEDSAKKVTITLDGDTGDVSAGGNGQDGTLKVTDKTGKFIMGYINAGVGGALFLSGPDGKQRAFLSGATSHLSIGGNGGGGDISLHSANASVAVFGQATPPATIKLEGDNGNIILRGNDKNRIRIDGSNADVWLGGNDANGDLVLFAASGDNSTPEKSTIHLRGSNGSIVLRDGKGTEWIRMGSGANVWLGGKGESGDLMLFHKDETDTADFKKATLWLSGHNGDIVLKNADCAEEFDISEAKEIEPGTVVVLDQKGQLQESKQAYDRKVAGVISGAGDYKPGIVLDKKHSSAHRMPVALVGKAYCKVDAQFSPIEVGDLLTTSATPGHAMKANDPLQAFGAVIGKALRSLKTGQGLIPILIALQ